MRQVIVLSGLLAAAMVGSYITWTGEGSEIDDADEVLVYQAGKNDLQKIAYKSEKVKVEVERRTDAKGDYIWIVATETKVIEPMPAEPEENEDEEKTVEQLTEEFLSEDAPVEEAPEEEEVPEPEIEITTTRYHGNSASNEVWENFSPLKALRELGKRSDMDAESLGLVTPTATIEVVRRSGPLELQIGGETYGAKDHYVATADKVFLVDDTVLRPLEFAMTRMVERAVHPLGETDIEQLDVQLPDGRNVSMVQRHRDDRAKAFWAMADTEDEEDDTAGTWVGKALKLRIASYAAPEDVGGELKSVFTLTVSGESQVWSVEVLEVDGDERATFYARPEYARSLVRLTRSLASDVIDDLDAIFPE